MKLGAIVASASSVISVLAVPAARAEQAGTRSIPEIVVTASALDQEIDETSTAVIVLSGDQLVRRRQATLGETLASQPGVHVDHFGGGASRPVIRGQTSPRVQPLSDGSQIQDASAVSPDHAVTTEPLLLQGIEVLRGPAALLYGGNAIGGAVNLLDAKVPTAAPQGGVSGAVEGRLGTADDERSGVGGLTVGVGPLAFHVEGVHRSSDDYRVPAAFGERRVDSSYNDTSTVSAGGSWLADRGYLGGAYTRQRSTYGLPGHDHAYEECQPHGAALHCGAHGDEYDHSQKDGAEAEREHGGAPFIRLKSERFDIRGEYLEILPGIDKARLRVSFSDYEHEEVDEGLVATTFKNKAHDARLEVTHAIAGLQGVFGIQHAKSNLDALGTEAFLPASATGNTSVFVMETLHIEPVRLEVAARQEWQSVKTTLGRKAGHQPFSISGAAVWDIDGDYTLALSLARSQRAPNVQELYAGGVHLATNTFELGTATLNKETAKSVDLTFRKTAGPTTFTVGAYHQTFEDYIFADTLDRSEDFRLIRYTGADATFTGLDGEVRHQVTGQIGASVFGDVVRARLANGLGNLPRIPAGRLGGRADGVWGAFSADLEYYHVFAQGRVASFETRTPGYDMLNATVAYELATGGGREAELFLRATNLTNTLAYNHASFIKGAAPLRGRNVVFGVRATF